MPTPYPTGFPMPTIGGFGATVSMGVLRPGEDTHQLQRRVFTNMPHNFALSFTMTLAQWAQWQAWVMNNGYRWFEMNLATLYAGSFNQVTSTVVIRLTSGLSAVLMSHDVVQVTVNAELAPSAIARFLEGTG
ncbi:MAG: hypothetical protein IOC86_16535 [Aestuariivirga sp.]|nr:hypothetical protein [Aestuariivirga sp.]